MQLNQEFEPVMKSSKNLETAAATISLTPHMFQLMSSGIYQHPERACIRELSCNAWDGHVAAGNVDKPFKVHLPNQLEPWFEVRDFGTGMTHEQVMKLYLTYGASTKRDSNDLIGGLGIGSKSPFAVAQSFTVTSYVDGTVRRYSVYMEEGIPQVTKLTESATTEPNGIAVRVAIPLDKINIFETEARRVYTHFPVKPECNKALPGLYDDLSVLAHQPDEFKIFSGQNHGTSVNTSIVMGNIEYPINLSEVVDDLESVVPSFLRSNITRALIYLPIGSVNIAASRESLQLTDTTKASIVAVFEKVAKQILTSFQSKLDTAKNLYEAVEVFYAALGKATISTSLLKNVSFQGKSLFDWIQEQDVSRTKFVLDINGDVIKDWSGKPKVEYAYEAVPGVELYRIWRKSEKRIEFSGFNTATHFSLFKDMKPSVLRNAVFVVDDRFQKNGNRKTVGRGAIFKEIAEIIYKERNHRDGVLYTFDTMADVDALCKLHHYPKDVVKILKMSDFEYAYVPKKVERGQVKLWEAHNGNFNEVKIDLSTYDDAQYYIRAEGNDLTSETLRQGMELKSICTLLAKIVPTQHVFMFRKTVWNKIPEDWIEIDMTVLSEIIAERPDLYIELNRRRLAKAAENRQPRLDRMNVQAVVMFGNKTYRNGYVETERLTGLPKPGGVNFEDNLEVFKHFFGRPQIVFADIFYAKWQYDSASLEFVLDIIPKKSKLYGKIQRAKTRADAVYKAERRNALERNKLLSWIDWGKVNFKDFAAHQGYKVTDYVAK